MIYRVIDFLGVFYEKMRVFYEKTKIGSIFDPKIPYFAPKTRHKRSLKPIF